MFSITVLVLLFLALLVLSSAIKVLREYERGVIFRLGKLLPEEHVRSALRSISRRKTNSCRIT